MKTQMNKLEKEQALTNKMMLISILIIGSILIIVGVKSFSSDAVLQTSNKFYTDASMAVTEKTANERNEVVMPRMQAIDVDFSTKVPQCLEADKMRKVILSKCQKAYSQALFALTEVEEPELFLEDVFAISEMQENYFNEENDKSFTEKENTYLDKLYKQKNTEVYAGLVSENIPAEYLAVEEDVPLEMKGWMKDETKFASNFHTVKHNQFLEAEVALKMEKTNEAIELNHLYSKFLAVESDPPLELEEWMVDARCWCPEKREKYDWYKKSYALLK